MNQQELDRLIELYFDGLTTEAEEHTLRHALADPAHTGAAADEARAVMGVFAAARCRRDSAVRKTSSPKLWRAAAAVVAAAIIGAVFMAIPRHTEREASYIAYHDGNTITDPETVMAMAFADLGAVAQAADAIDHSIEANIAAFGAALNSENTLTQ